MVYPTQIDMIFFFSGFVLSLVDELMPRATPIPCEQALDTCLHGKAMSCKNP
jgi:hypothetical protein